jgi:hypothetical protein
MDCRWTCWRDNVLAGSRVRFISPRSTHTQTSGKGRIANKQDKLRGRSSSRTRHLGHAENPVVPVLAVSRIGGQYFAFVAEKWQRGCSAEAVKVGQMVGNDYVRRGGMIAGQQECR